MAGNFKKFITFEGIDFSGKTTQIGLLLEKLAEHGIEPVLLREPGGTAISERIRDILLDTAHPEMSEKTEFLLYEAARSQLVHQKILPLLQDGRHVIADRFFDSTTAYQGHGRGLDLQTVKILNGFATSDLLPYRTFFIDISPAEAERRQQAHGRTRDRLESAGPAFFTKIRRGFLQLAVEEKDRFVVIDGHRPPEVIAGDIWQYVRPLWLE